MQRTNEYVLSGISPFSQLIVLFVQIMPIFLSFDPYTPLVFLTLALIQILILGRVSLKRFLKIILPLSILPMGLLILNALFSQNKGDETLFYLFSITITKDSLKRGIILFLRSLALIVTSIGYLLVTDPLKLVNALMQQVKLSPRFGFSIYVAWNSIPHLKEDLRRIQYTHRIRLKGQKRKFSELIPTAVTLLSGAIRYAERASISMTARGVERAGNRTYLKAIPWRGADSAYLLIMSGIIILLTCLLILEGLFVFGLG